jgi:tRNA(Leu) C34 or U34 (ribose-2'-O)-methylase TrmL
MKTALYPWPDDLPRSATPAIVLMNPKFPHNVGQVIRMCAAFEAKQIVYTGDRMEELLGELGRIPREERLKAYKHVGLERDDRPFDRFKATKASVVCVEVDATAEYLPYFEHPTNAVYVFGPEDGSVFKAARHDCHRFVQIPSLHCLNLATAVGLLLYDRHAKETYARI